MRRVRVRKSRTFPRFYYSCCCGSNSSLIIFIYSLVLFVWSKIWIRAITDSSSHSHHEDMLSSYCTQEWICRRRKTDFVTLEIESGIKLFLMHSVVDMLRSVRIKKMHGHAARARNTRCASHCDAKFIVLVIYARSTLIEGFFACKYIWFAIRIEWRVPAARSKRRRRTSTYMHLFPFIPLESFSFVLPKGVHTSCTSFAGSRNAKCTKAASENI